MPLQSPRRPRDKISSPALQRALGECSAIKREFRGRPPAFVPWRSPCLFRAHQETTPRSDQAEKNLHLRAVSLSTATQVLANRNPRIWQARSTQLRRSFLGRDLVCNIVILGLRYDSPRHHFAGFAIRTPGNHPVCFRRSHAREAQQLMFCGSVQIERLIAVPALAYPFGHRFGIALHFRRCLCRFLLQILRVLSLCAARERGQQQNCGNVLISEEVHFGYLLSAVLDDFSPLSGCPFPRGMGPSAIQSVFSPSYCGPTPASPIPR